MNFLVRRCIVFVGLTVAIPLFGADFQHGAMMRVAQGNPRPPWSARKPRMEIRFSEAPTFQAYSKQRCGRPHAKSRACEITASLAQGGAHQG